MIDADKGAARVSRASILAVSNIVGIGVTSLKKRSSVSGGAHWIVEVDRDLSPLEIVALQLAMGDDIRRGALNLSRVLNGATAQDPYNLLFDEKLTLKKGFIQHGKKKGC
jgi:hypothetical protein